MYTNEKKYNSILDSFPLPNTIAFLPAIYRNQIFCYKKKKLIYFVF